MKRSGGKPIEQKEHIIPARLCTSADFSKNEEYEEIFAISEKLSLNLYCPAFENFDGNVSISGTRNNMLQRYFEFQILRCDHISGKRVGHTHKCASEEEIDEYISDLEVSVYVMNQIIDFTIYGREPTFSIQQYLGSTLLNKNFVMIDDISLELNTVDTEDDFIQLGQYKYYEYYQVANHIRNKLYPTSYHEPGIVYNARIGLD